MKLVKQEKKPNMQQLRQLSLSYFKINILPQYEVEVRKTIANTLSEWFMTYKLSAPLSTGIQRPTQLMNINFSNWYEIMNNILTSTIYW